APADRSLLRPGGRLLRRLGFGDGDGPGVSPGPALGTGVPRPRPAVRRDVDGRPVQGRPGPAGNLRGDEPRRPGPPGQTPHRTRRVQSRFAARAATPQTTTAAAR